MANFKIGDLITFSYPAVHQQGTRAHDKQPTVLVLHPNWGGLVHGLNFNYLTPDEINTVRMLIDPMFEMQYREALSKKNPGAFAELENILTGKVEGAEGPNTRVAKITSPRGFYLNIIKPFIVGRRWEPYRLYRPEKMTNVRIVQTSTHMTGQDQYARYRAQQQKDLQRQQTATQQGSATQPEPTKSNLMQWFKNKFQNMRGSQMPGFKPHGDGALPGTRDEEE